MMTLLTFNNQENLKGELMSLNWIELFRDKYTFERVYRHQVKRY